MGRSIPSFRMLIDIERLEWANFKKELSKKDKQIFNKLFLIPKLYCHTLSSLSNPITIEPIILSILFNNFKLINQISKDTQSLNLTLSKKKYFKTLSQQQYKLRTSRLAHNIIR